MTELDGIENGNVFNRIYNLFVDNEGQLIQIKFIKNQLNIN